MKKCFAIFTLLFILSAFVLSCGATEVITETAPESLSKTEDIATEELTSEALREIFSEGELEDLLEDVESGRVSVEDAIIKIAAKAGVTREEAEALLEEWLALGDKYLGGTEWWDETSREARENKEFWIILILAVVAVASIIFGGVTLFVGVIKKINRIEFGTESVMGHSEENKTAISQTLGDLKKNVTEVLENYKVLEKNIADKDLKITELEEHNSELESGILDAEMYILQILKLIYSRTNLPLSDKSLLDLWHARSVASLEKRMSPENIKKHNEIQNILKGGEEING